MSIGIGLPIADPARLVEWARRADAGPFRTLGLLDRLVYDNPEPLVALAALAGATTRIRLQTEVLLAPLRETALLAKQAATLNRMARGRFTLGLGVGGRPDDYAAAGRDIHRRGRRLDQQMADLHRVWSGHAWSEAAGPIGPAPTATAAGPIVPAPSDTAAGDGTVGRGRPEVLFGGFRPAALRRVARFGDGFLGAAPPAYLGDLFRAVGASWTATGRPGRPRLVAQGNVALGPAATVAEARASVLAYYAPDEHAARAAAGLLTTARAVRAFIAECRDLGADEVMLYCWAIDPDQIDRLAETAG